jgi:hypothetical protein
LGREHCKQIGGGYKKQPEHKSQSVFVKVFIKVFERFQVIVFRFYEIPEFGLLLQTSIKKP